MRRARRTWGQRVVLAGTSVLAVVALAAAAALWDVARLSASVRRVPVSNALDRGGLGGAAPVPGGPQNFLVVGVDGTGGTRDDDGGGPRPVLSDTIVVLRTDPAHASAELLPLPRDLRVDVPGHGRRKINAAMSLGAAEDPDGGGQRLLIETIRAELGIAVNHYVEVDFAGFTRIVDRVGGLSLWFPAPARDRRAGIEVAAPGCLHLDAEQTLHLARSRYYDALVDGDWARDPSSDLGRIRRQQLILRAVLAEAIDDGARNPLQLRRLLGDLAGSVTLDDALALDDLLDLAMAYRGLALSDVVTSDLEVTFAEDGDVLRRDTAANAALLDRFRGAEPSPEVADPGEGDPTPPAGSVAPVDGSSASTPGPGPGSGSTTVTPGAADDPLAPFTPSLTTPTGERCRG